MNKFFIKAMLKEMELKQKLRSLVYEENGSSTLTDNAGVIIIGVVVFSAILVFAISFTNNDFLPAIKKKIMGLLS